MEIYDSNDDKIYDSNDHPNELPKCTLSIVLKMVEMVNVRHVLPQ